ncbi:hypothetical protein O181_025303 [Austropuccinia psidii MF-1]|uniref:Uncharacterized protein n=1 Tax=Austropuccinia psidii MF-1 TaxID=1389203 RepID=A0A9Q3GYZ6_9BASI|nr:hypothetical protein [Austropuccinia psidii MF-1]
MNVSGLKNDVGYATAQTSSTWSIPNISVTPIPINPTNTQINVSEGPESTPQISSNANPQSEFPCGFLFNSEKVTECHHPYASKPRTAHSSSSREKIVDDEDKNMSPNRSETNDEPRMGKFMVHEEGTQSNSEFTHPQMPLTQSILEKSEIRQQRNQARKAHNVAKRTIQKEKQTWLKVELPENFHGMRSAVHGHCLFLLKVRDKDFSSLPAPPSTEGRKIGIKVSGHLQYVPKDVLN